MAERTIKHVSFSYRVPIPDPVREGETIMVEKKAGRGETVDIPLKEDIQRGEKFGAFVATNENVEEVSSIRELSDDELVAWLKDDRPTVREVIGAAEGEPELARRLLDAEDAATDGQSRTGVIRGLSHVVGEAQ